MDDDREYVLRVKGARGKESYITIKEFSITYYSCGLKAGDRIRLKEDLPIYDSEGISTGTVYPSGEIWTVLTGAKEDPSCLWLRQADGKLHSWDDDPTIFDTFELA